MIVVTGATGFIGSHLVAQLRSHGHDVLGVSRYRPRDETLFLQRDLGDIELLIPEKIDLEAIGRIIETYSPSVVIHLDANVNPPGLERDPGKAVRDNFLHAFDWMNACAETGVKRFILASSIGVLPKIQYEPIDAAHPLVLEAEGPGSSFYGASKAAAELFGLSFSKSTDLEFSAIRCSAVYGFGMQWPIGIKPALEAIASGEKVLMPAFGPPRDYTPVSYVADIFEAAALSPAPAPGILYAATGRPLVSVSELNETLSAEFPEADIIVTPEDTDPQGIESLYRGVISMDSTLRALGVPPLEGSLGEHLHSAVSLHRSFLEWSAGS